VFKSEFYQDLSQTLQQVLGRNSWKLQTQKYNFIYFFDILSFTLFSKNICCKHLSLSAQKIGPMWKSVYHTVIKAHQSLSI